MVHDICRRAKKHHSSRTTDAGDDASTRNKERTNLEAARRASLADEEACLIREREMVAGASSSTPVIGERSTTSGAEIELGTTEGDPSKTVTGSGKLDTPTC